MSFKKSDTRAKIKSFVSEDEAQDINAKRQEEWERVRKPGDPLKCPEVEPRSLFEQLQAQKEKAQQEHDEKYDIKKMFRGIDNDEAVFLEFASKQQAEMDGRRFAVTAEVKEFRNEVAKLQTEATPSTSVTEDKKKVHPALGKKRSQLDLLMGGVKTKRKRSEPESSEEEKTDKKLSVSSDQNLTAPSTEEKEGTPEDINKSSSLGNEESLALGEASVTESASVGLNGGAVVGQYMGYIASIGDYSDSSDSDSSSSDSDIITFFSKDK